VLEVAMLRVARRESRTREETLLDRIERLEQRLDAGIPSSAALAPAAPLPNGPLLAPRARTPKAARAEPTPPAPPDPPPAPSEAQPVDDADPAAVATNITLDDVIEAWPDMLASLKTPVRAAVQDAQPIAIDDQGVIVFGVPERSWQRTNDRFRKEAETIKQAFADRLGAAPRFMLRRHDFDDRDALRPQSGPDARVAAPTAVGDEEVDLDELVDADDAPPSDSVERLASAFGAEVIEERPRR
jgi:hypothetical protein